MDAEKKHDLSMMTNMELSSHNEWDPQARRRGPSRAGWYKPASHLLDADGGARAPLKRSRESSRSIISLTY